MHSVSDQCLAHQGGFGLEQGSKNKIVIMNELEFSEAPNTLEMPTGKEQIASRHGNVVVQ